MRSVTYALLVCCGIAASPALAEKPQGNNDSKSKAVERRSGAAAERRDSGRTRGSSDSARSGSSSRSETADRQRPERGTSSGATLTEAQRRHPRAGTGTGYDRDRNHGGGYHGGYRGGYYGGNYGGRRSHGGWGFGYYDNDWSLFWNPYGYGNRWGYGYYPYSYYGSPRYYGSTYYAPRYRTYDRDGAGALRLIVEPERTRVYVDGYYAGIVDDFDGLLQRLHVAPGRHEIALKLDGHRTHVYRVYVPYDRTIKLHHEMVRGDGEDRNEDFATAPRGYDDDRDDDRRRRDDRDDRDYGRRDDRDDRDRDRDRDSADMGTLRFDVSPSNAAVYVDDQFRGTASELSRLRLPAGRHRVEIVRPGYRTLVREVDVRAGDESELELELERS